MTKVKKFSLFLLTLMLSILGAICFAGVGAVSLLKADEDVGYEQTTLSSLATNSQTAGCYFKLAGDETVTSSIPSFSGVLDGGGYTITVSGTAIFDVLDNATVYNLKICMQEIELSDSPENSLTSCGILANSIINNSIVYGIELSNLNVILNNTTALPHKNFGLIAGYVSSSQISQVKISKVQITNYYYSQAGEEDAAPTKSAYLINSNLNMGFLAGRVGDGAQLFNNLVSNSFVNLSFENSTANANIGGLVGVVYSGAFITNNIVSYSSSTTTLSILDGGGNQIGYVSDITLSQIGVNNTLSLGYLIGTVSTNDLKIVNNIVSAESGDIFTYKSNIVSTGGYVGTFAFNPLNDDFSCNVLVNTNNWVGNILDEQLSAYLNLNKISTPALINTYLNNKDNWNVVYSWDFKNIWKQNLTSNLPDLQYFDVYSATFSSEQSVRSLKIQNLPTINNSYGGVVIGKIAFTLDGVNAPEASTSLNNIDYGSSIYISVYVTSENNFDKFFKITGLLLNESLIYDCEQKIATFDYSVEQLSGGSVEESGAEHNVLIFAIHGFKSNTSGTYSVQLSRNTFKLNINVVPEVSDEDDEGEVIVTYPGKVKNSIATDSNTSTQVDMQYGTNYTYETSEVNSDYSRIADWYQSYSSSEFDASNPVNFTTRKLEWVFNENCVFFNRNPEDTDDQKVYFSISDYYYNNADESDPLNNIFELYVMFSKDVQDIKIYFMFEDETIITQKLTDIIINDGSVAVTYNEDEGCFYAKVRFNVENVITLDKVVSDYQFIGWRKEYITLSSSGLDEYSGILFIDKDEKAETISVYCVFENASEGGIGLLWLWILLGALGVGVIVTIVIVVKKKKSNTSYRKFMY